MLHKVNVSPTSRKLVESVPAGRMFRNPAQPMERHDKQNAVDSAFLADRGCLSQPHVDKNSAGSHAA